MATAPDTVPFHALDVAEVVSRARTHRGQGLTSAEAATRLATLGPNRITRRRGVPAWRKLLDQFLAPLVVILIGAAALSWYLGELVEALVIGVVVVLNALIGFVQERRAESAIGALDALVKSEATVIRDGVKGRIPTADVVEGDLVFLQSGDGVPADLRLLEVRDLQVEEAALTGESVPAQKREGALPESTPLADRTNLAFSGTAVTYGQALGVVVGTGDRTQTGRIAHLIASADTLETPLTRRIAALSTFLIRVILAVCVLMLGVEWWRGKSLIDTFHAAVAFAVGAIPEGLPAAVTILLAVGVGRMAGRRALVRRLPAVETLGSTTVICSDKTGTLTENQMTVQRVVAGGATYEVTGAGYDAAGEVLREQAARRADDDPVLRELAAVASLCVDSRLVRSEGAPTRVEGDPTEAALIVFAQKAGFQPLAHVRRGVVPFESQHMYMATLDERSEGLVLHVKGSSDALLARCRDALGADGRLSPFNLAAANTAVEEMASQGLRVLALARKPMPGATDVSHAGVSGLTFVGLLGLIDPPREEARRAIATCHTAGIRVKMITGDHATTAAAIASQLGLEGARDPGTGRLRALTGTDLDRLPEADWPATAEEVAVFARVTPEQKLRLVRALQARRHVVAMTGDGVNDAPALKQADIGVAMGAGGTDVARAASAMILTDDNFATIAAAVEEGRTVYDNLRKFIAWTLPTNGGEGLVLLLAIAFDTQLPVLPVQLLWINMGTALLLGTALVFEAPEPGIMERPPRAPDASLLDRGMQWRTLIMSAAVAAFAFTLFEWSLWRGSSLEVAQTMAVNAIVSAEAGYLFACRSLAWPAWRLPVGNAWVWYGVLAMIAAQVAYTHLPLMNRLFQSAPLDAVAWALVLLTGVLTWLAAEVKKMVVAQPPPPAARSGVRTWSILSVLVCLLGVVPASAAPRAQAPCPDGKPCGASDSVLGGQVLVPAGTFKMGSPETEAGRAYDEKVVEVTLSRPLLAMESEVTQGMWRAVTGKNPSKHKQCGPRCPVERVSWWDAVRFANAVSLRERRRPAYVIEGEEVRLDRDSDA